MGLSRMGELEEMRGAGVRNERQGEGSGREVGRTGEGESRSRETELLKESWISGAWKGILKREGSLVGNMEAGNQNEKFIGMRKEALLGRDER